MDSFYQTNGLRFHLKKHYCSKLLNYPLNISRLNFLVLACLSSSLLIRKNFLVLASQLGFFIKITNQTKLAYVYAEIYSTKNLILHKTKKEKTFSCFRIYHSGKRCGQESNTKNARTSDKIKGN